jgi:hypothetical protein
VAIKVAKRPLLTGILKNISFFAGEVKAINADLHAI